MDEETSKPKTSKPETTYDPSAMIQEADGWYALSLDGMNSEARTERLLHAIYLLLRAQVLAEGNSWDPLAPKGPQFA